MKTICIQCPMGCSLDITKNGEEIIVTGNGCIRGIQYGKEELTAPKRVVTSLVKTPNCLYSVKTNKAIPKEKIFEILKEIQQSSFTNDEMKIGDCILRNILETNADLIVTGRTNLNK